MTTTSTAPHPALALMDRRDALTIHLAPRVAELVQAAIGDAGVRLTSTHRPSSRLQGVTIEVHAPLPKGYWSIDLRFVPIGPTRGDGLGGARVACVADVPGTKLGVTDAAHDTAGFDAWLASIILLVAERYRDELTEW